MDEQAVGSELFIEEIDPQKCQCHAKLQDAESGQKPPCGLQVYPRQKRASLYMIKVQLCLGVICLFE